MTGTARERLATLLAAQDEVSSSVQLRAKPPTDLHVEVEGVGRVSLPVPAAQARRLRDLGRPARFGRGEQTLTDAAVRDTWEVPKELVRVEWAGGQGLGPELEAVRAELGLPGNCRLTADLHSLLVYEKGQFFLPHQDSEKDDAMVATLVVMLPSAHTGGELVVHHLGEATTYRGSKTHVSLVAFYADCRHEVRPVTSGYRVALTYNLLVDGDPAGRLADAATVDEAARCLDEHFTTRIRHRYRDATSEPLSRLAFLLDHEYTEHGLAWPRLKGNDGHRAFLIRAAAEAADCEVVLALTDIKETWEAYDPDEYEGYRRYGRRSRRFEDDASDDQNDDERYELQYLIDSSVRLTWWVDESGTVEDISLNLSGSEVCAATPSSELRPYTSEYEGYMGNYGNTLDRWYRRGAVLVWPRDRSFANRAEASPSWAMDELCVRARDEDPAAARAVAATLVPFWDAAVRTQERPGQLLAKTLAAAVALADPEAAAMLLRPFRVENFRSRHLAAVAALVGHHGEPWLDELLGAWFGTGPSWTSVRELDRPRWLTSLPALCEALQAEGEPGRSTAHRLLELAWDWLARSISECVASSSTAWWRQRLDGLGAPLAALIVAAATAHKTDLQARIVDFCRNQGDDVGICVLPALRASAASPALPRPDDVFARLADDQMTRLGARLARPVRAADDWSIHLPGGCACAQCGTLRQFLADPAQRTLEWPLAKAGRSHVHSRIDQAELPVSHQTRRQGRPHTLVLTKTAKLFEREAQQRVRDQADLDWILDRWKFVVEPPGP